LVEFGLNLAVSPGRDHERFSTCKQRLDRPRFGIEGVVRQQGLGRHIRLQRVGAFQIMGLARRQDEVQRMAQRIDKCMNLGAQPAFAAPDRVAFTVFLSVPALR
jgi:hypothetical protein